MSFLGKSYKYFVKPVFFKFEPEGAHHRCVALGKALGNFGITKSILNQLFTYENKKLEQNYFGINFKNPVGLAAGFDYNCELTHVLKNVGFGFESSGTVTWKPYEGNKTPRLGRLVKSKSLFVNKGFKSLGLPEVLEKMKFDSDFPVGISIGATNSPETSDSKSQIKDILSSFKYLNEEKSDVSKNFSYFEVNISCPNVQGSGSLANEDDLDVLLSEIQNINVSNKPIFVKFQLEISWEEAKKLIKIMIKNRVSAIIIANLLKKEKNKTSKNFNKSEIEHWKNLKGNYSGKPTFEMSNDLIQKTYLEFGDKIKIIGLGGIFSAEDAYKKIKLGASLVQLITGMIFEGPNLISEINSGLVKLLEKDGYSHISEAIGKSTKN